MRVWLTSAALAGCAIFAGGIARAQVPPIAPSAEAIFLSAKGAWRSRSEAPFVAYNLRERYQWRTRAHDNWWQASYRTSDRALALHRIVVAEDERERLKGLPIALNMRYKTRDMRADSFDTNANADAFPILDPQIEPNASFGMLKREPKATLVGNRVTRDGATSLDRSSPSPPATASPHPESIPQARDFPNAIATEKPLRDIGHVEAVSRDYAIVLAGSERIRGSDTYHLALTPLRDPHVYRLRDLWVDRSNYATVQLAVQGLFEGKPYDDARWTVGFTPIDGRYYVQQIRTDDALRFGLDRVVTGLEFDFVAYAFPEKIPAISFDRLL